MSMAMRSEVFSKQICHSIIFCLIICFFLVGKIDFPFIFVRKFEKSMNISLLLKLLVLSIN